MVTVADSKYINNLLKNIERKTIPFEKLDKKLPKGHEAFLGGTFFTKDVPMPVYFIPRGMGKKVHKLLLKIAEGNDKMGPVFKEIHKKYTGEQLTQQCVKARKRLVGVHADKLKRMIPKNPHAYIAFEAKLFLPDVGLIRREKGKLKIIKPPKKLADKHFVYTR